MSMEAAGADLFHLDVMDAHFVPNLTFGPMIVEAIRRSTTLPLDVHLMMQHPNQYIDAFAKAGADALTIHVEPPVDIAGTLAMIDRAGLKRGLSLNPGTELDILRPYLSRLDLVLVMSVQPGFGGQSFQPSALAKISELAAWRASEGYDYLISVDGGINDQTVAACHEAGADILVSGSWLFGAVNRAAAINLLRRGQAKADNP